MFDVNKEVYSPPLAVECAWLVIGFSMLALLYCPLIFSSLSAVFNRAEGVVIRAETLYTRKSHDCN